MDAGNDVDRLREVGLFGGLNDAALTELERDEFDVALVDLEMPVADGYTVARAVRAWQGGEASRGCRLVAFSAHGRDEVWGRCAASGFDDFVGKPIDRRELLRVVDESAAARTRN